MSHYELFFEFQGESLAARRLRSTTDSKTGWRIEDFVVFPSGKPFESIDQIELYLTAQGEGWLHWPTKFVAGHKKLGTAVADARNRNPEIYDYTVLVDLHKRADLTDRPTTRRLPSSGTDSEDAVRRIQELVKEDNVLLLPSGSKRYVGNVHRTRVSMGTERR